VVDELKVFCGGKESRDGDGDRYSLEVPARLFSNRWLYTRAVELKLKDLPKRRGTWAIRSPTSGRPAARVRFAPDGTRHATSTSS